MQWIVYVFNLGAPTRATGAAHVALFSRWTRVCASRPTHRACLNAKAFCKARLRRKLAFQGTQSYNKIAGLLARFKCLSYKTHFTRW